MIDGIRFSETKDVPVPKLRALFLSEQWADFMDNDEVAFYVEVALYVVTAWKGDEIIGFARLQGDGRISVLISDVLVRSDLQGQGIGNELVRRLMDHIRKLDPYYINVEPIREREVHLYSKFGFTSEPGYGLMEVRTPKLAEKIARVRGEGS